MKYDLTRELNLLERRALLGCPKREREAVAARIRMAISHAVSEAFDVGRLYPANHPLPSTAFVGASRRVAKSIHKFIAEDRRREHAEAKPRRRRTTPDIPE